MCERVCAGNAISRTVEKTEEGDKITLTFNLGSCTFCATCADFCSRKAIELTGDYHMIATKEEDLLTKYNEKSQELIDLDIKNRKNSKQSMQNDLYDLMIEKQDALNEAESKARLAAAAEGIELTFDQTLWEAKAKQAGASSDTMALVRAASAAKPACG